MSKSISARSFSRAGRWRGLIASHLLVALVWACGGGSGEQGSDGKSEGGGGGGGGGGLVGTCQDPLDFDALSRYHGPTPYLKARIADGEANETGSCGGDGREQVVRWVAPRDGRVGFRLSSADASLTLHIRERCSDPESEKLCAKGDQMLVFDVEEGQIIDVIVDSPRVKDTEFELGAIFVPSQLEEGEPCRLDRSTGSCAEGLHCSEKEGVCMVVPAAERPVLQSAEIEIRDELVIFKVEGEAPNRNVYAIELRFFDGAGEPVQVLGTFEAAADITSQAYGKESFTAEASVARAEVSKASTVKLWLLDAKFVPSNSLELEFPWSDEETHGVAGERP